MKLLKPHKDFVRETYEEFKSRYEGFGKELYSKIHEKMPNIFMNLYFYQCQNFQKEDSYVEYLDDNHSFVIQLDPSNEVIVLWNEHGQIEIGTWSINEYDEAIYYIKSEFLK